MRTVLELTHSEYMRCHQAHRRVVDGKKQLLAQDMSSGKRVWLDVRIVPDATLERKRGAHDDPQAG